VPKICNGANIAESIGSIPILPKSINYPDACIGVG